MTPALNLRSTPRQARYRPSSTLRNGVMTRTLMMTRIWSLTPIRTPTRS